VGARTLVVHVHAGLEKVAISHASVGILPGSLPRLYTRHARSRHASAFAEDEGILLALQHHDRVCRIRLRMPVPNLQELIVAMEEEYPMLEYLYIATLTKKKTSLVLPRTTTTLPGLHELCLSNNVPNACDCLEPRHALASEDPPICLFPPELFDSTAFVHASVGDPRDVVSRSCSQS
jgi:hypothetical protein